MLETFHQLREPPFGVNPDPRFLYLSRTHREAFASLMYRIEMDSGFLAMVAQPGMGKTTLLFHLLQQLQPKARTAFIFQTQCTPNELLRHLLSEFECPIDSTDPVRVSRELKSMLVSEASAGRRCVLVVDEAQNLGPEVLETIRLLSNFETPQRKLLNIVLSGQNELGEMLARPELRQLRQRMSCIIRLEGFTRGEVALYIAHRLAVAGYTGELFELFSADAVARIADLSEGVPRIINNLCFNALSLSYALGGKQIDRSVIEEAALDLGLSANGVEAGAREMFERQGGEAILEFPAAFAEVTNDATRSAERSDAVAGEKIEEQPDKLYGPAESNPPIVPTAPECSDLIASRSADSSHDRGRQREPLLARGLACLLVLLLTPAVDWPVSHSVSAQPIEKLSSVSAPSAAISLEPSHEPSTRTRKHAIVSRGRHTNKRSSSLELIRHYRGPEGPVDLGLAAFVPEPLLETHPLEAMPLSARTPMVVNAPRMTARRPVLGSFGGTASASHYIPPKPISQPAPSISAWYRHPKEDVQLLLSISSSGEVSDVGILSGHGTLAYAAKRAAKMWRYEPALANGTPVSSKVMVTVEFLQH